MTITLPPTLAKMVESKVHSGLYASESEVVCEALRNEFVRESFSDWLREAAASGFGELDAGNYDELDRAILFSRVTGRSDT